MRPGLRVQGVLVVWIRPFGLEVLGLGFWKLLITGLYDMSHRWGFGFNTESIMRPKPKSSKPQMGPQTHREEDGASH